MILDDASFWVIQHTPPTLLAELTSDKDYQEKNQ